MHAAHDAWRKSTHSDDGSDCVEVHRDLSALRDSKNQAGLALAGDARALVAAVKADQFAGR